MNQRLIRLAVLILAGRLLWMHVIPAWTEIATDFPNYYTAAWAVRQGDPLMDLYDTAWSQREGARSGISNQTVLFNYFTPFSALVMWPVADLTPLTAKRIWIVVSLFALAASVLALSRFLGVPRMLVLLVALLGGDALGNNFMFGQFYVVLTLLLIMVMILAERHPKASALVLSFASIVKVFPAVFIGAFAWRGRWRLTVWAIAGVAVLAALGVAVMGWTPYHIYLDEVLPRTLRGEIQDPYNVRWNTLQALLRRSFVSEPGLNPYPIVDLPGAFFFLRPFLSVTILLATITEFCPTFIGFGALIAAISLVTPSQASYHQILFFPAVVAAISTTRDIRVRMLFAGAFALICSNAMGATARWDSGLAMLLAFPRVYIVAGLWFAFLCLMKARPRWLPIIAVAGVIGIVSASADYNNWKASVADGATMVRPEEHGLMENKPTVGLGGLTFSALRPEGYTIFHPSAYGAGLVYERNGEVFGTLPNGVPVTGHDLSEPALGSQSVVALRRSGDAWVVLENGGRDSIWRELFRRSSVVHDPAIEPGTGSVAFSEWVEGHYRIGLWNRSTGEIQTLLGGPEDYRYPAYKPDGERMAFATNSSGNWDVAQLTLSDGSRESLTTSPANDTMPAYSMDGRQIYFASDRHRGYRFTAIYVIALPH